jgi:hypothetical protein
MHSLESGLWTTTAIRAAESCDRDTRHPIYELTKTSIGKGGGVYPSDYTLVTMTGVWVVLPWSSV